MSSHDDSLPSGEEILGLHISKSRTVNNFKFCIFTSIINTILVTKFQMNQSPISLFSGSGPKSPRSW